MNDHQRESLERAIEQIWAAYHTMDDLQQELDEPKITKMHGDLESVYKQGMDMADMYDLNPEPYSE